jgi:Tfp pilus assembly protein PilX
MEFNKKNYFKIRRNNGFTLLLASLLAGLLLIIGLGIFNIVVKELSLTSSAKDSESAFYSADSGIECVLYWDTKIGNTFATSSVSDPPIPPINCAGEDISATWVISGATPNRAITTFDLDFPEGGTQCVIVTVSKTNSGADTTVLSRGYNTCDVTNPRRVERGIQVSY